MNQKSFVIAALLAATALCHFNTIGICSRHLKPALLKM